ncbi:MAG: prohibitin family protein, partial [candidate division WOR-3 bacterium]
KEAKMLFVFGVLALAFGIALWFIVGATAGRRASLTGAMGAINAVRGIISGAAIRVGIIAILFSIIVIIQPGQVGVQILFGSALPNVLREGFHIVNPFVRVEKMSVRTQEYTMSVVGEEGQVKRDDSIDALTKDGLTVKLDVTVWYRLLPEEAVNVYRNLGPEYVSIIVRPAIRTALRDAASYFTAVDIYAGKREDFVALCKTKMDESLTGKGVVIERVLLRNVGLPDRVRQAIEEKLSAEQEAQRMQFVLEKERLEAERKRVEAGGLADAQKIINATLTPQYLQYLYLTSLQKMAESNNTTFLIAPYDRSFLPLINVR